MYFKLLNRGKKIEYIIFKSKRIIIQFIKMMLWYDIVSNKNDYRMKDYLYKKKTSILESTVKDNKISKSLQ